MENRNEVQLPELSVKVLDEKELHLVLGGLMCTNGTKSSCDRDGTNDGD